MVMTIRLLLAAHDLHVVLLQLVPQLIFLFLRFLWEGGVKNWIRKNWRLLTLQLASASSLSRSTWIFSSSQDPLDVPSEVDEAVDLAHVSFSARRESLSLCTEAWKPVRHGISQEHYSLTRVAV